MKRALLILTACCLVVSAGSAFADQTELRLGMHIKSRAAKNYCTTNAPVDLACSAGTGSAAVLTGVSGAAYNVYIAALDINVGSGLSATSFGLEYDDPSTFASIDALCADLDFKSVAPDPVFPAHGGFTTPTWDALANCQNDPDPSDPEGQGTAMIYALYVYAYGAGQMCVAPKNGTILEAADCSFANWDMMPFYPLNVGCIGFDGAPGKDACELAFVPVKETTWGGLKKNFKGE